jgi:hypothetical protein
MTKEARSTQNASRDTILNIVLAIILVVLVIRLAGFIVAFGKESLQMDFSAFYAAGQSVGEGLSPYVNHVDRSPPIWDGINTYRHSRFLYPPPVARSFQPLSVFSYHVAKHIWMLLGVAALGGSLWIAARLAGIARSSRPMLIAGIITAAYFPVLTLLERGQIDSITLLLLIGAIAWMRDSRTSRGAGALLALATLLKLHCVFLLPFLLLRRQWRVVAGFFAAGTALLMLGMAVDGYARVAGYLTDELPRISRYGERGSREMKLPPQTLVPLVEMVRTGRTVMDERRYDVEYFRFALNASVVRTPLGRATWSLLRGWGIPVAPAQISVLFLGACFLGLLAWQRWYGRPDGPDRQAWELIYWQTVLVVVLLCAPVTWAMGTVWLLPVAIIGLSELPRVNSLATAAPLLACAAGLLIAGFPDPYWPFSQGVLDQKYIVGELLCLAGLLGLWRLQGLRFVAFKTRQGDGHPVES